MQTVIVHLRHPVFLHRDLGTARTVAIATLVGGAILSGLFWPPFAAGTIWRALSSGQGVLSPSREAGDVFTYMLALSGIWTVVLPALVAAKLRGFRVSVKAVALLPVYYLLVTAATWTAMFHLALWPHHWAKTAHGRSGRRPAPRIGQARAPLNSPLAAAFGRWTSGMKIFHWAVAAQSGT